MNAPLTYKAAGVDIDAADNLIDAIKPLVASTNTQGTAGTGTIRLPHGHVAWGMDGVGTKLKLATRYGIHDTVGIDLVAMVANDLLRKGATPRALLNYYGTNKLDVDEAEEVIGGIAEGCRQAGMEISGGETAEMPGTFAGGGYEMVAAGLGTVDYPMDMANVADGDVILGLPSSGIHSNGYSLVRKVLDKWGIVPDDDLKHELLTPTRIYVRPVVAAMQTGLVKGVAHITGGGLVQKPLTMVPKTGAQLDISRYWPDEIPTVFHSLQHHGGVPWSDMARTFNLGIGMMLLVPNVTASIQKVMEALTANGLDKAFVLGRLKLGGSQPSRVILPPYLN